MKKIGLVFDSSCGITKEEANKLGVGFIPLNITVNDKEYLAGVDISREELYKAMEDKNTIVKTSSPTGENIKEALDFVLENNDEAIFIGISHKWSGTQNAVRTIVENFDKYKDVVTIYESLYSSPWIGLYIKDMLSIIKDYDDVNEFIKILDKASNYMTACLSPGNIWWFYKGGRISKMQYILGNLIKISPILKVSDGEIDKTQVIKTRGIKKAMLKMVELVKGEIEKLKLPNGFFKYVMLDTNNKELKKMSVNIMCEELKIKESDVIFTGLTTEQTAHMGPDSFGLTIYVSLKNIINGGLK